jgi:peptidoglycan/LPS O-acetylase OafA/YrhL
LQTGKLTQLTFTRFIAAIAIVIFHAKDRVFPFTYGSIHDFVSYFNVLVSYFFVLSGFILAVNYKQVENIFQFYISRFARIYPLYFFALLFTLLLIFCARTPKDSVSFNKAITSILLIQAWFKEYALSYNFPSWSLSVEAFFYSLFPLLIYLLGKVSIKKQLFLVLSFWIIMQLVFVNMINKGLYFVLYNPFFHLSTFLVGIGSGRLFIAKYQLLLNHISKLELVSAVSVILVGYLVISGNMYFFKFYQNGLLALFFLFIIYTIALSRKKIFCIFSNQYLQYLGEISYGIYILQFPVSILVFGFIDRVFHFSSSTSFYIYLPVLIVFAAITYELIEKPYRVRLKEWLTKKSND